jgi:hypothetical protein
VERREGVGSIETFDGAAVDRVIRSRDTRTP